MTKERLRQLLSDVSDFAYTQGVLHFCPNDIDHEKAYEFKMKAEDAKMLILEDFPTESSNE